MLLALSIAACSAGGSAQLRVQTTLALSIQCVIVPSMWFEAGVAAAGQNRCP
jgi:hypothetical protein